MAKEQSIKLHPEYGLNPTMGVCPYCGKETGVIALLGNSIKGEAPRTMVLSSEPCKDCQEVMARGFTFIIVNDDKLPAGFVVVDKSAVGDLPEDVLKVGKACITVDDAKTMFPDFKLKETAS